jgi:prevent-host-death family protein
MLDFPMSWMNNLDGLEDTMTIGLFAAKQKLSELVERAAQGEEIVITCRGKERARLIGTNVKSKRSVKEIFDSFAQVRMKLPKGTTVKDLINEGRRF